MDSYRIQSKIEVPRDVRIIWVYLKTDSYIWFQISKNSVLDPASPGITLSDNL